MECDHIKALDLARKETWGESHQIVQQHADKLSCLIHAYLHRIDGDISNAKYWYKQAGVDMPNNTLDDELDRLYEMAKESRK